MFPNLKYCRMIGTAGFSTMQYIIYRGDKKTKIRTYYNGNPVPVLRVSKTIRTRILLRTTNLPLIFSVPVPVLQFQ